MTVSEKRAYARKNIGLMRNIDICRHLEISNALLHYYVSDFNPKEKIGDKIKKRYKYESVEKRINTEKDYSTNGFFDPNKWAQCLPV